MDAAATADDLLEKDKALRDLLTRLQIQQARRNDASKLIGQAKAKKDEAGAAALMAEVAGLKEAIQAGEQEQREREEALKAALAVIPNLPADDVPDGVDETANVPMPARAFGKPPGINNPKQHFELGEALGLMDFERAGKVSGARFVYLKGDLAKLERALGAFMLDIHTGQFGYTEMSPPVLVRDQAMFGTGQLPKFEEDLFFASQLLSPSNPSLNDDADWDWKRLAMSGAALGRIALEIKKTHRGWHSCRSRMAEESYSEG